MYDLIIRKGLVIDGTGNPGFPGDVAVAGDRIEVVGDLTETKVRVEIDASNQVVCPGFIDSTATPTSCCWPSPRQSRRSCRASPPR